MSHTSRVCASEWAGEAEQLAASQTLLQQLAEIIADQKQAKNQAANFTNDMNQKTSK
jgi:hypothetical protein